MKKAIYNIFVRECTDGRAYNKAISGYIFYAGGFAFGVSNHYIAPDGSEKKCHEWTITELVTGFSVGADGSATTRDEAIKNFCGNERLQELVSVAVGKYLFNGGENRNPDFVA